MGHIYAFILAISAINGVFAYIDWLQMKQHWNTTGDIIATLGFVAHLAIFLWGATLLLKVFPGLAC